MSEVGGRSDPTLQSSSGYNTESNLQILSKG